MIACVVEIHEIPFLIVSVVHVLTQASVALYNLQVSFLPKIKVSCLVLNVLYALRSPHTTKCLTSYLHVTCLPSTNLAVAKFLKLTELQVVLKVPGVLSEESYWEDRPLLGAEPDIYTKKKTPCVWLFLYLASYSYYQHHIIAFFLSNSTFFCQKESQCGTIICSELW